jgi:hypothetical protein
MAHDPLVNCLRLVPGWQVSIKDQSGQIVVTGYVRFHEYELGIVSQALHHGKWITGRFVCWWDRDMAEAQRRQQMSPFQYPTI